MLTVSLVEDDDRDRELLSRRIEAAKGLRLVSAYATAEEALRRFPREKPDVALVDIKLPGMDGIECIRCLRQIVPPLLGQALATGGGPMTSSVARRVINHFEGQPKLTTPLTNKESAVLRNLAEGLSYKGIAAKHSITVNTVRQHVRAIYDKLHVHSRNEAVKFAQARPSPPGHSTRT